MSFQLNRHNFDFSIPMNPNGSNEPTIIAMDGKRLDGVSGLCIKAGANGFTNVAIEFEGSAAVKFTGHLMARVNSETLEELFRGVFEEAMLASTGGDEDLLHEMIFGRDQGLRADFVKRCVECAIEKTNSKE